MSQPTGAAAAQELAPLVPQGNPRQDAPTRLPQAVQAKKRPSWLKIIGIIVFLLFVAGTVFGLWWYLGYRAANSASSVS